MDLMSVLDVAIVGSIFAIMEVIKAVDKNRKLARFYPAMVLALGLMAAAFKANPFNWQTFGYNAMLYAGASSFIFKFGKTTLLGK